MSEACNTYEGGEGYYNLVVPPGYFPSDGMQERSPAEWVHIVEAAAANGEIRYELADKIINSIQRMPMLEGEQHVSVSFSGGKDSQAIFLLALMRYPWRRIISLFADTDDEWPETYKSIDQFEAWAGIKIHRLQSMGIHTLLREVIPVWPKMGMRHCTKNLKMLPQRDWFDENGYDQDRKRGVPSFRDGRPIELRHSQPLTLAGERWAESKNRSQLPFDSRDEIMLRWTHRPVLDWRIEDIWEFIFWMQAPINPIYTMGVKRAACAGCIFANAAEIEILGEHHPQHLIEWVKTEEAIGVPRQGKRSFKDIHDTLVSEGRLGSKSFFEWDGDELREVM